QGRSALTWEVATTATPRDLGHRLAALGMVAGDPPMAVVMALRRAPPVAPSGVDVTAVATLDAFRTYVTITHEVFGMMANLPLALENIDRDGPQTLADPRATRYLASIDGQPVAAAMATFTPVGAILHAGSTRAAARGRGAYRALVAARWAEAVR